MRGDEPWPGGNNPKFENIGGGPGLGPGLCDNGCDDSDEALGVKSKAPKEFDSDGVGLFIGCDEGGRGIYKQNNKIYSNVISIDAVEPERYFFY